MGFKSHEGHLFLVVSRTIRDIACPLALYIDDANNNDEVGQAALASLVNGRGVSITDDTLRR
jgi:hypothetical protein